MPENLTKEQNLAVNLKRHISVKANAGSGKTKVLVDRYIRILEDSYTKSADAKVTPYEIVAMTFTRKAAGEMLKKVVDKIEILQIESPTSDPKIITAYNKIRNDLNAARISTIHSFASSLLRDFAVEANVNPNFVELTESMKHRIKNEAFEYVITKIYQEPESHLLTLLKSYINRYSIKALEENTNSLIYKKEILVSLNKSGFYEQPAQELLNKYINLYIDHIKPKLRDICHFTNLAFDHTSENDKKNYQEKSKKFKELYADYLLNKTLTFDNISKYIIALSDIYSTTNRVKGPKGLPNYFNDFRCEALDYDYSGIPDVLSDYNFTTDFLINSTLMQIEDAKFILEFTNLVLRKTEEEKQKYAMLDFDDILIKTDELLSNADVAKKISSKIKYIMVDEFQDTNPIQYSIVKKLVPGLFEKQFSYPTSPEVFIVGDEKQSIYGFRGADVSIIGDATECIEHHQQHREEDYMLRKQFKNCSDEELSGNIVLNASFRMKPALALFTNTIFSKLMPDSIAENNSIEKYRAKYNKIVCAKSNIENAEPYHQVLQQNGFSLTSNEMTDFGSVEFLITENKYKYETQAIADSITDILKLGKYKASDICILCRDKVHINELTQEFSNREIPYFLHSGSGFYKTIEVRNVLSLLTFLSDTKNDLALVSALKSPFFGLRDSDLLVLTNYESPKVGAILWEKLQDYKAIPLISDEIRLRFEHSANLINYLLRIAYRMSIPKLIRTLLKESGWISKITPFKDKDQRVANIYKLIDSAREFEKQGFVSIYDFVKELETLEEISKDGEAGINTENAVGIMTIHAAKGLEFPIVYLYDTKRDLVTKTKSNSFNIDSDLGITFKNASLIDERFFGKVENIPYKLAKSKNLEISVYEEIRLLYVAITRAIDKLFISASIIKFNSKTNLPEITKEKTSYISMIISAIPNFPNIMELKDSSFVMNNNILDFLYENNPISIENIDLPIDYKMLTNKDEQSEKLLDFEDFSINKHYYSGADLDDVMGHERDIFFSASKLSTFKKDRKRFWLEYILEMDDFLLKKSLDKFQKSEAGGVLGQETGTAIHGVFEKMNRWYDSDNNIIKTDEFSIVLSEALALIDAVGNQQIIQRITSEVNNVTRTNLIQSKEFDFKTMKNEFALRYAFGRDFLSGVIDVLITDQNGNYEIWDFKSDFLTQDGILAKAENYQEQIKLYGYLIYLLNDKPALIKARLLFTRLAKPNAKNVEWTYLFKWSSTEMEDYKIELHERIKEIYNEYQL